MWVCLGRLFRFVVCGFGAVWGVLDVWLWCLWVWLLFVVYLLCCFGCYPVLCVGFRLVLAVYRYVGCVSCLCLRAWMVDFGCLICLFWV